MTGKEGSVNQSRLCGTGNRIVSEVTWLTELRSAQIYCRTFQHVGAPGNVRGENLLNDNSLIFYPFTFII